MIYVQDNFLPEDQFLALKKAVDSAYEAKEPKEMLDSHFGITWEPYKITFPIAKTGNWLDSCMPNNPECVPALEKMEDTMTSMGIQELTNWSSWFQYSVDNMSLPPHRDQASLRKSDPKDIYTAVIYTSDWQTGWGGELVAGKPVFDRPGGRVKALDPITHEIQPLPNRFIIWSREEWHKVYKSTVNDPEYVRGFFGSSWSSVESSNPNKDHNPYVRFSFTEIK